MADNRYNCLIVPSDEENVSEAASEEEFSAAAAIFREVEATNAPAQAPQAQPMASTPAPRAQPVAITASPAAVEDQGPPAKRARMSTATTTVLANSPSHHTRAQPQPPSPPSDSDIFSLSTDNSSLMVPHFQPNPTPQQLADSLSLLPPPLQQYRPASYFSSINPTSTSHNILDVLPGPVSFNSAFFQPPPRENAASRATVAQTVDQPARAQTEEEKFAALQADLYDAVYGRASQPITLPPVVPAQGHDGSRRYQHVGWETAPNAVRVGLPDHQMGVIEFCTFFPNHTIWPLAIIRFQSHGWELLNIAKAQCFAWGYNNETTLNKRSQVVRQHSKFACQEKFNGDTSLRRVGITRMRQGNNPDARQWQPRAYVVQDMATGQRPVFINALLRDLGAQAPNWPAGQDVGVVTQCILFAVAHRDVDYHVSDIPQMVIDNNFQMPTEAANVEQWDQNALVRAQRLWRTSGFFIWTRDG